MELYSSLDIVDYNSVIDKYIYLFFFCYLVDYIDTTVIILWPVAHTDIRIGVAKAK